ncbi:hypothetical protein [Mucilaginibacter pedocola]|nr:hypothetical protein [Mucilaginibacter pedocola]
MRTFVSLLFLLTTTAATSLAQVPPASKPELCILDIKAATALVGKHARISSAGSVYSTFNDSDSQSWPSTEMKKLGGRSGWKKYVPAAGDAGTIVHVFMSKGSKPQPIYLLKVADKYVPVACSGIEIMP